MSNVPQNQQAYQNPQAGNQNVTVNITAPPQSQALPAVVSFFFPGIGQLIQGRVPAWLIWWGTFFLAFLGEIGLFFTVIGIPLAIIFHMCIHIAQICDAAWFDPMKAETQINMKVMKFAWVIVGLMYVCLIGAALLIAVGVSMSGSPQ